MRALKSTLIVLLLGLTTAVVVGLVLLTLFLPSLLQRFACAPYGIRCTIGQAGIRPRLNMTADLVIDHLILFDPDGRGAALRVKHLAATLNIPGLIFTGQVMPTDVRIEHPELLLRQLDDGRWNLPALVQETQQHLQPSTQPAPWQFPQVSVTGGTLYIRTHQVTDVNISLEPKRAPVLFKVQAHAAAGGRSIRISGALRDTLDGQILAQVREQAPGDAGATTPPGISRSLTARAALRFRVNHPDRAVTIPEWSFEADGAMARGKAAIRYASGPPAYTVTVAAWHADLGVLTRQLSLPWLSGLTGIAEGRPTTLQGRWPELPVGQVAAMLKGGGLELPARQFRAVELTGDLSLYRTDNRLQLQAGLYGKALELLGRRYDTPSLHASLSLDLATGDVTAEALHASIAGMSVKARGAGRRWGREDLILTTTELRIEPTLLAQLPQLAGGVTITRLVDPSLRVWWPGAGRPWRVEIDGPSVQLRAAAMNDAAVLQRARIAVQGVGMSGRSLDGTLAVEQADLGGRRLRALRARIEYGPDRIRLPEFHVAAGDGAVQGHASWLRTASGQEVHLTLSAHGLRPQSLLASGEHTGQAHGIALDTELSVDATLGGPQSLVAGGRIIIRDLALGPARNTMTSAPPLMRLQGSIPFTLDKGLLTIPTTTLRGDGGFAFNVTGSVPLGRDGSGVARIRLSVPWTELSTLRSTVTALTGGQPEAARLAGQLQADLTLDGRNYRGALALRNVSIGSTFFRLEAATGVIPLHGRIGRSSIGAADGASPSTQIGGRRLSEREYQAAVERLSQISAEVPASLTIDSLRYDPIELRNIKIALASSEGRITAQRLTFDAWGGRWIARGTVEPPGGGIALTVLTEGLSLRAICDAFPPIKGYISGRVNGMAELRIPGLALGRAQGNARFWAVDSSQEKRKISRTLIERLAGQQIRYFSLFGVARRYDRGVLDVALKAGDLVFHELEISHTTLGYRDLDVRVSPTFNKIGLAHLLESVGEAIERVRGSAASNAGR